MKTLNNLWLVWKKLWLYFIFYYRNSS